MNTIKLNTIGTPKMSGGNSGGGTANKYKYYDCLGDEKDESGYINHSTYFADNVKVIDSVTGNLMIAPEAYIDSDEPNTIVAVAYDMNKRVYVDGKWVPFEELITAWEEIDLSTHPEITEEEFYHIPEEEIWDCSTQEGMKDAYEKLWALVERYGEEHINSKTLPLTPWYNPLKFVGDSSFEEIDSSAIVGVRRGNNAVEDYTFIVFNPYGEYALKKYTSKKDGSVSYGCGFFE